MRIMAYLLRQNRPPAEVMQIFPAEEARIHAAIQQANPNDSCPCGSQKPIKNCHGKKTRKDR
jgi:uncharacterized protein YecA (UPF0149 family)